MNPDYENQLEQAISRELHGLPDRKAPATLQRRVLAILARREALPWYRQSWDQWPLAIRAAALVGLSAVFTVLCLTVAHAPHSDGIVVLGHRLSSLVAPLRALATAANAVASIALSLVKGLGPGVVTGAIAAVVLSYGLCLGLGTVYLRLAWAPSRK